MTDIRIPFSEIKDILKKVLTRYDFDPERAGLGAQLFAQANLDGVPSHGVNRFLSFLTFIQKGYVFPENLPELLGNFGALERWDGQLGPGNLNAHQCMERAIYLAKTHGIGCVALQNTNHWMRAGNYGWQAVEAGCIGVCFTNTKPNMPAWGGKEPKLGNNPIVIAIPREKGPVVLDMAVSQYSYGKMDIFRREGKEMPYDAGFDNEGKLSRSPSEIIREELALPIGLWKGAGLALMLDLLATLLSGGHGTWQIGNNGAEFGVSQVFLVFDPEKLGMEDWMEEKSDEIIDDLVQSKAFRDYESVRYPGENTLKIRKENMEKGVPVNEEKWNEILKLLP
ncbi:3-dehydro-L-gulonate 2-dehydrogenase [Echinicola jeungdonensis]|uniref:3-dehydro-L-gulonate 2-dehydrogenase n=1 Tax=Echinicola jeungdonensis TaxID=709343 RepID=A0ABV5J3Y2_9BACT|nr:3-dehydro-L-gulonate 2-dehydrogenase [Echinicola jeungdonensis]MDN3670640.1 3-dehydro-L-gulonate 2-dehydrogenase [Echinicola jeungdonensis]